EVRSRLDLVGTADFLAAAPAGQLDVAGREAAVAAVDGQLASGEQIGQAAGMDLGHDSVEGQLGVREERAADPPREVLDDQRKVLLRSDVQPVPAGLDRDP